MRTLAAVLATALLLAPEASAQAFQAFGARAGVTVSSLAITEPRYGSATGFLVAGSAAFGLTHDLSAVVELEYGLRGYSFEQASPGASRESGRLQFLSLPVMVRVDVPLAEDALIHLSAGPRVDFLLSVDPAQLADGDPDPLGAAIETGMSGGVSFAGGFALRRLIGRSVGLEARYVLGLGDLAPEIIGQSMTLRALDLTLHVTF